MRNKDAVEADVATIDAQHDSDRAQWKAERDRLQEQLADASEELERLREKT